MFRFKSRKSRSSITSPPSTNSKPSPQSPDPKPLKVSRLDFTTANPQSSSPLFSLPGEIRNQIWEYTLTPYNDLTRAYPTSLIYYRPDFIAPRTSAVALLRTCKAIYSEAWYLPWTTAELSFYLTEDERCPPRVETVWSVQPILNHLHAKGVDTSIDRVRVFAQLYRLENGLGLQNILRMNHFKPREVTVTIRHTDFWFWERDENLRVGGQWVEYCRFPETVKIVKVEFESLERKKNQVDEIAQQAVKDWEFRRVDGRRFSAVIKGKKTEGGKLEGEMEVMRWTGDSTFRGLRWLRDETEPGKLNYYVKTVIWRVKNEVENLWNDSGSSSLSVSYAPPLYTLVDTTTKEELRRVAKHANIDGSVEELRIAIDAWRTANPKQAMQVYRSWDM